ASSCSSCLLFFFASRRRHTRCYRDWSSDVCSSDLPTLTVPFCTWIMIGYFASIPKELDEAALIDGAGYLQMLTKIFIPVALPGKIGRASCRERVEMSVDDESGKEERAAHEYSNRRS